MKNIIIIIGLLICTHLSAQYQSKVWVADQGDGLIKTPSFMRITPIPM